MHVDSNNPEISRALERMAELVVEGGGFVADDFTVHERDGFMSASIKDQIGIADRLLVRYPREVTVPLDGLDWRSDYDVLELNSEPHDLTPLQRGLLDSWSTIVNEGQKLPELRRKLPFFSLTDPATRKHLADGGFFRSLGEASPERLHDSLGKMHARTGAASDSKTMPGATRDPDEKASDQTTAQQRVTELIPLKAFVNHAPHGSRQHHRRFGTDVVVLTSRTSNEQETFENYGDLDGLATTVHHGYVCSDAQQVHLVGHQVDDPHLGFVRINHNAPRKWVHGGRDVPTVRRTDDGFVIQSLTVRSNNLERVRTLLAMLYRTKGLGETESADAAHSLMINATSDSRAYLAELDRLATAALTPEPTDQTLVLTNLIEAARLQMDMLDRWWLAAA